MTIRPATVEDVGAVTALEQQVFGADAWSEPSVHEELTGSDRCAVLASEDGSVVGYAVTRDSGDVVDLQRIAVDPAHRRTGVATRLLTTVRTAARARGAHRMLLEVSAANDSAMAFYAREGFTEIDRRPRYYRDGSDALVLRAALGGTVCGGRTG